MDAKTLLLVGGAAAGALAIGVAVGKRTAVGGRGGGAAAGGAGGPEGFTLPPSTATKDEEVAELRRQLRAKELELMMGEEAGGVPTLKRRPSTVLGDGTEVEMTPAEVERIRQIFNVFDVERRGFIDAADLRKVHQRLGEPITEEEAATGVRMMAPDGKVPFDKFVAFFNKKHVADGESRGDNDRYMARFQFMKAKISSPEVARISCEATGVYPSLEYRVHFYHTDSHGVKTQVSPWHSIPLKNDDGTLNFVCEIPKWTRKKFEIATGEPFNPIKQDTKNGALREYQWGDMLFNYGAFPQTWEDPEHVTEDTGAGGDNDPLDVMELGTKQWPTGSIVKVKVLGVLALIDSGETDWKVLCINVSDPLADKLHDVEDIRAHMPGAVEAIHLWLRDYKSPKVNEFGFDGACQNRDYAMGVVEETHEFWKALIKRHPNAIGGATV